MVSRLESRLNAAIQLALELPEDSDAVAIWDRFASAISKLSTRQQLLVAGEALSGLAEVCFLKSDSFFGDKADGDAPLEDSSEESGVTLDADWLEGLIRKTSSLDLSRFEKPDTRLRLPGEESSEELVTNQLLYDEVADSSQSLDQVLAIAHSESASEWQEKILSILQLEILPIDFWALKEKTQLSPSALFLGLLLGSEDWYLRKNDEVVSEWGYGSILVSLTEFK